MTPEPTRNPLYRVTKRRDIQHGLQVDEGLYRMVDRKISLHFRSHPIVPLEGQIEG